MFRLHVAFFGLIAAFASARAQDVPLSVVPSSSEVWNDSLATLTRGLLRIPPSLPSRARTQRYAPVISAIVPGGGQFLLGNDRFVGYLAVEALSWWNYIKDVNERTAQETEYKVLARHVARLPFASGSPDLLPDADWSYYEKMRDYAESGSYSLATSGPVVPDTDATTYNGSRWLLAQRTFSTREAALREYMRTAVTPEFEWSWKEGLQYDRFKRITDKRNDANRAAWTNLMVIGANHILSMVDAFTTVRLRARSDGMGGTSIGASIRW